MCDLKYSLKKSPHLTFEHCEPRQYVVRDQHDLYFPSSVDSSVELSVSTVVYCSEPLDSSLAQLNCACS